MMSVHGLAETIQNKDNTTTILKLFISVTVIFKK